MRSMDKKSRAHTRHVRIHIRAARRLAMSTQTGAIPTVRPGSAYTGPFDTTLKTRTRERPCDFRCDSLGDVMASKIFLLLFTACVLACPAHVSCLHVILHVFRLCKSCSSVSRLKARSDSPNCSTCRPPEAGCSGDPCENDSERVSAGGSTVASTA